MQASDELGKKVTDNKNLKHPPQANESNSNQGQASEESQDVTKEAQALDDLAAIKAEIEKLKKESSENYNKFVRAMADMENIKRRAEKEKSDIRQYALESFLKEMLPILDSFNQATENTEKEAKDADKAEKGESFFEGMLMVKRQLSETLEKHGLTGIEAKGAPFDPNLHQAISKVESTEIDQEIVKDEYSKGYTLNGRLLRPAMVSVMVPSESN